MEYEFKTENFEKEVLMSDLPVFVDFYADWCPPCKMMAPVVERLAEEYAGRIKVGKCDIDANMPVAQKYRVVNIPTFIVFKGGQPVDTIVGAMSQEELYDRIDESIAN